VPDGNDHPNIDQRLEALAQNLELLSQMHMDNERRLAGLEQQTAKAFADTAQRFAETAHRFSETAQRFSETLGFINKLAHVAEAHDRRIENLEQR
jgi:ABC-type transporter Mla subunit MlaD